MNTKFQIFLDLEETVITSWAEGLLCNSSRVRDFLAEHNASKFTVFSFAVWNDKDKQDFEQLHRRGLERGLDCRVASCPSTEDFMQADTALTGVHFDSVTDFISIRGKVGAFTNWVRFQGISHAILVDDVVPNIDIISRDTGGITRFINVMDI
jgi:hypothetical protein